MDGLLYVVSEPGELALAEFHDWYDHEHGPARVALEGVAYGDRYHAIDERTPSWLALYGLDLDVLATDEYLRLIRHRSSREEHVLAAVDSLDRRVYETSASYGAVDLDAPAPCLIAVAMEAGEGGDTAIDQWYQEEHIAALQAVPGWLSSYRYRLVEGEGLTHLAVHRWESPASLASPEFHAATSTPWRERIFASLSAHERRVFGYWSSFSVDERSLHSDQQSQAQ
jgi:hypothetical protein